MSVWRPDFQTLRLFVAVCEESSISRAAEREAIVPSAVSKRISELEESFGLALLVRSNRGVAPTAAGAAFLHHARQILLSSVRLQSEMADYAQGTRGHVRVAANVSSILQFLPRDIASFVAAYPDIRIDLEEKVSSAVVEAVREGQVDLGVALAQPGAEGVVQRHYASDRLVVLVPASHAFARRDAIAFEKTLGQDFVSTQPQAPTTTFLSGIAGRHGHVLRYRMHVSTMEALCHIVAEGLGIAIVAEGAARPYQAALGLRAVALSECWAAREIVVYRRGGAPPQGPQGLFLAHLEDRHAAPP